MLSGGSQSELAPNLLERDIIAWFRTGQIQLACRLGVNDFLLAQFSKKRNGRLHLSVRKSIHQCVEAVAVGGHAFKYSSSVGSGRSPDKATSRLTGATSRRHPAGTPLLYPCYKEIAYGNPSWFEQEPLPGRRSVLRAGLGPEFFERQFQDSGQRQRLPELAG
ncbi:hypothetical protein SBA4_4530013 [Candidatus Sulfopaludibacter sp. SbA4]|nr:hypothetical protein SBA4_4530013 [Candidatus Sulfopaludibacter sp. SbA4]